MSIISRRAELLFATLLFSQGLFLLLSNQSSSQILPSADGQPGREQGIPASIRRRLACMIYEAFLAAAIVLVFFMLPLAVIGYVFKRLPAGEWLWVALFILLGFYFVGFWIKQGQTLAMKTWRLKLVNRADGSVLSRRKAWLRYGLAWPSLISGLGLLWAMFDPERLFLHDRFLQTIVAEIEKSQKNKKIEN